MILVPLRFPDSESNERAQRQSDRWCVVTESFGNNDQIVRDWITAQVGPEAAESLGPPDLSANTLASAAVQLSTPGLYGLGQPTLSNVAPDSAGLPQFVAASGYWQRMQYVQRMVVGVGDWVLRVDCIGGKLNIQNAYPWNVWTRVDATESNKLLEVRWMRQRYKVQGDDTSIAWFWDVYRLDGPNGPTFDVVDSEGKSWANVHIRVGDGYAPVGGLTGDAYPFRFKDGEPFIPFVFYSDCDDGLFWHDSSRRGATRGAFNSITAATYNLRAMFSASMPPAIACNMVPPQANVQNVGEANTGGPTAVRSISTPPGTVLFTFSHEERQPSFYQLSNAGNLQALNQATVNYYQSQQTRLGFSSDDVQRDGANPTSAAALSISRSAKRERAEMVAPFFRTRDLLVVKMAAGMAFHQAIGNWPDEGWSLEYRSIPMSTEEAKAERDNLDWQVEKGMLSTVDVYLKMHPGQSREEAVLHLRRVREEEALLAAPVPAVSPPAKEAQPDTTELPADDDTSEEAESEAIATVAAELEALEELLPVDAEGAEIDVPAIRASIADIREALGLK